MIDATQLNGMDRWILDYFQHEGRATPNLLRLEHRDEQIRSDADVEFDELSSEERADYATSRQWVSDRLSRLSEHGHIRKVHPEDKSAVYELVNDPRDGEDE